MHRNHLILIAAVCCPVAAVPAQSPAGSVGGTVYLRMQGGETLRGSALTVKLLDPRNTLTAEFWSYCARERSEGRIVDSTVTAMLDEAQSVGGSILPAARAGAEARAMEFDRRSDVLADRAVTTSVDGAYRFERVQPGDYIVAAIWRVGHESVVWAIPVGVSTGQVSVDLHNVNLVELPREVLACTARDSSP